MLFENDRDIMRQFYCDCWEKAKKGHKLEPLEAQIAEVIKLHPEYHAVLENPELAKSREYPPEMGETNPFLHLSMHLGIREQVSIDRPPGIRERISQLALKVGEHEAEHSVMDCLAEAMWQAQRSGVAPDEVRYLRCLEEKLIQS